jgi:hypothetical protein
VGHRLGVAGQAEDAVHPPGAHGGEERLQVEVEDHRAARVQPRGRQRRAPRPKPVGRVVGRDAVEDVVQHLALEVLELALGRLQQAGRAVGLA